MLLIRKNQHETQEEVVRLLMSKQMTQLHLIFIYCLLLNFASVLLGMGGVKISLFTEVKYFQIPDL